MPHRCGEEDKTWFRTERFYQINGKWFYMTREGTEEGPFGNRDSAEADLAGYIRSASNGNSGNTGLSDRLAH